MVQVRVHKGDLGLCQFCVRSLSPLVLLFSDAPVKATVGLFGKSLESSGDFSMRCQCLTSSFLRLYVGKCSVYVVVNLERSFVQVCSKVSK